MAELLPVGNLKIGTFKLEGALVVGKYRFLLF
jgi:hypothetical protein